MVTNEQRKKRLGEVDERTAELYGSLEVTRRLKQTASEHKIEQDDVLIDLFGDTLLGFYSQNEFADHLSETLGISPSTASDIENDLGDLLGGTDDTQIHKKMTPVMASNEAPKAPTEISGQQKQRVQSNKSAGKQELEESEPEFLPHTTDEIEEVPGEKPQEKTEEGSDDTHRVPSYAKPLTDIPRYDAYEDPYHEKPE